MLYWLKNLYFKNLEMAQDQINCQKLLSFHILGRTFINGDSCIIGVVLHEWYSEFFNCLTLNLVFFLDGSEQMQPQLNL